MLIGIPLVRVVVRGEAQAAMVHTVLREVAAAVGGLGAVTAAVGVPGAAMDLREAFWPAIIIAK